MEDLLKQVNKGYSINAASIKPHGSVWRLTSPNHTSYALKRINTNSQNFLNLVQTITEYQKLGFQSLAPILSTNHGDWLIHFHEDAYFLSPWYEGIKPVFNHPTHVKMIAGCIGKLHRLSASNSLLHNLSCHDFFAECLCNYDCLKQVQTDLKSLNNRNRIDRAILKWSEYFLEQASFCIAGLTQYKADWPIIATQKGFCHNDLAPGNIIIRNGKCYLFDFEHSGCHLFVRELSILTIRILQANQWDANLLDIILDAYSLERPLIPEERRIFPFILCFPRRFWRLCHQRFHERLDWSEKRFQRRLWEIIEEEKKRIQYLQNQILFDSHLIVQSKEEP